MYPVMLHAEGIFQDIVWNFPGLQPTVVDCRGQHSLVQQIAVILQHEIQNSKTKIYIVSFQMALELGYLKGGYVNFWFCCSGFVLQDHCNLLYPGLLLLEPGNKVNTSAVRKCYVVGR